MNKTEHYTVVVIGTGFGGSMTALSLARKLAAVNAKEPDKPKKQILMLERGTWWTTPVGTVQDKEVAAFKFLADDHKQPVQYWPSQNHFKGVIDIVTRCLRRGRNKDGLYDLTAFGPTGISSLFRKRDGVSVLRANGVGGGSLVYSNITMRPPDLIFNDKRWPMSWKPDERDHYYNLARHAIGYGVLSALDASDAKNIPYVDKNNDKQLPPKAVNPGLSNIVTRSARLDPHWQVVNKGDSFNPRGTKKIVIHEPRKPGSQDPPIPDRANALWIDRARIFQTAVGKLTSDFGAVDLAINDITPEGTPLGPTEPPADYPLENSVNYCERQGRCNVGCLPGARHTLNKQLMTAIYGKPDGSAGPTFDNLKLYPLAEVDFIRALGGGGYEVHYDQYELHDTHEPVGKRRVIVTADNVIVAAGCLGTNEIMLRSKRNGLPNLSEKVGYGFSTNGDYLAFLENTAERVRLTRGPVTTSFGHFNTDDPGDDGANHRFHTIEDQGIPPAFASLLGVGLPLIRSLSKGRNRFLFLAWAIIWWGVKQAWLLVSAPFKNYRNRQDAFKSEDEISANMMCIAGIGRAAAIGQFTLGGLGETSLRIKRVKLKPGDKKQFYDDPVYNDLTSTLKALAQRLRDPGLPAGEFTNPFLTNVFRRVKAASLTVSHPLGGCRMARDVEDGVVDEYGRVFDKGKQNEQPEDRFYEGLYVADASIIPTALGVNPSLTISALTLRIARKISDGF